MTTISPSAQTQTFTRRASTAVLITLWVLAQSSHAAGLAQELYWQAGFFSKHMAPGSAPTIVAVSSKGLRQMDHGAHCAHTAPGNCQVLGLYRDGEHHIFVSADLAAAHDELTQILYQAVVVHEYTHYLQWLSRSQLSNCQREDEAYSVEFRYLASHFDTWVVKRLIEPFRDLQC